MAEDKDAIIAALIESNEILQEEVTRLRNQPRVLRTVIKALRASLESYRQQVANAKANDEIFKAYCEGQFDRPVLSEVQGGLPTPSEPVESSVMNGEEASTPTTSS